MTDVLKLFSGGSSPFIITSPSANPASPQLEDTVFDGGQQPLLRKQKGSIYIPSGPGWGYGPGGYAGVSVPINNPYPNGRHYVVGLGYNTADGIWRTPFQTNVQSTLAYAVGGNYVCYTGTGIGVATDATRVWGFSSYTPIPNIGVIGQDCICIPNGDKGGGCTMQCFNISGWNGTSSPRAAYVSYLLFENTIGG